MQNGNKKRSELCTKTENETRRGGGRLNSPKIVEKQRNIWFYSTILTLCLVLIGGSLLLIFSLLPKANSVADGYITIYVSPSAGGTVNGQKDGSTYGYGLGNVNYFTATANSGYYFDHWGGGRKEKKLSQVSIGDIYDNSVSKYIAYFSVGSAYYITPVSSNTTMGTVSGEGNTKVGSSATVVATAKTGYSLVSWTNASGVVVSTSATYTFTPTADTTLTANFSKNDAILTLNSNDTSMGTVSGAGTYLKNKTVTATATPASGYMFVCWKNSAGAVVSYDAVYSFTITESITLTAYFSDFVVMENTGTAIANVIKAYDTDRLEMTLLIKPDTGKYISAISFDNSVYYSIDYLEATIYEACPYAQNVSYAVNKATNYLGLTFKYVNTTAFKMYVMTTSENYSSLKKPVSGGLFSGVAVSATLGGAVLLVGDDYDNLSDTSTITCSAIVNQQGYTFAGWYYASDMNTPISTKASDRFEKSAIYGQEVVAKFVQANNPNVNSETNNTTDFL